MSHASAAVCIEQTRHGMLIFLFDRVLLCLKRSLRIANAAQQMTNVTRGSSGPVTLFVEILNKLVNLTPLAIYIMNIECNACFSLILFFFSFFCLFTICCRYLYFFEKGNPQITASVIQGLIELIKTEMQSDNSTANPVSDAFFTSTLRYIEFQKQKGGAMGEKYDSIKL